MSPPFMNAIIPYNMSGNSPTSGSKVLRCWCRIPPVWPAKGPSPRFGSVSRAFWIGGLEVDGSWTGLRM